MVLLMGVLIPRLPFVANGLIVLGVFINCFYLMSMWGVYPHVLGEINLQGDMVYGW